MQQDPFTYWLGKLANLNASKSAGRGIAPHKPLMMFTVMDLIESGDVTDGWVKYDVRLVSRFRDYWELVRERQKNKPEITMPFHALGGDRDKVWERFTADGQVSHAQETTRLCSLDPQLFACLQDADFRHQARKSMIVRYFTPSEQVMLSARLGIPVPDTAEIAQLQQDAEEFQAKQRKGRDARFKSDVVSGYYHTCAFTGYRLETEDRSIVQACHIHEHSKSGNDDLNNGLALTPDAHWMFDQGLWTAKPKGELFLIEVAIGRYQETSPYSRNLAESHGNPLHFHPSARLRPDRAHFEWHFKERFLG